MTHPDIDGHACDTPMMDEGNGTTAYCWACGAVATYKGDTGNLQGHGTPREA